MAKVNKIDANSVGLRAAEETSQGVLPVTPVWKEVEVNSYSDFGQSVTTVARSPITADRQNRRAVVTDLEASAGFSADLSNASLFDFGKGIFRADMRTKSEQAIAVVDGVDDEYDVTSGAGYYAGDLLFAQGFDASANNGLKNVTGATALTVEVAESLSAATGQSGIIRRVGFEFAAGDLEVDASGDYVTLTSTIKDMTELGLIPGEWVFVGGDETTDSFTTSANNGHKRVKSVSANAVVLDKSGAAMVTEAGGVKTMRLFFASRVLKNESDPSLISQYSYQLERTMGAPDDALPSEIQSEYARGCLVNQAQVNITQADKMTFDLSFMAQDMEFRSGSTGVKTGDRPTSSCGTVYNSSTDVSRINLSIISMTDEYVVPLFAELSEINFTIDNKVVANKAVGRIGAFSHTDGKFDVSGSMKAFFADQAAQEAIVANSAVTLDMHFYKNNSGMSFDFPMITLSDGKPDVQADAVVELPLSFTASTAGCMDANFNHTLLAMEWDYLPTAADL